MNLLSDSLRHVKRVLKNPDHVDTHILSNCINKIKSLEVEIQGIKGEILSVDNFGGYVRKASDIEQTLFILRVVIYHLMEQTIKEPTPHIVRMPMMGGVNLPRIGILTFDTTF